MGIRGKRRESVCGGIRSLPENLACALDALEADELLRGVLGERLFGSYLAVKRAEWKEYRTTVSEWEVGQYLNRF